MCLTGDDLPITVALKPGVSDVITRFQVLAEDRLALVSIVTEYRGVPNDPALNVLDLIVPEYPVGSGVTSATSFGLSKTRPFSSAKDTVVGEIFFPRRLIAGHNRIVKLLSVSDQFVLRNGNICGADDGCSGQKFNER